LLERPAWRSEKIRISPIFQYSVQIIVNKKCMVRGAMKDKKKLPFPILYETKEEIIDTIIIPSFI